MFKQDCTCFLITLKGNHKLDFFYQSFYQVNFIDCVEEWFQQDNDNKDTDGSFDIYFVGDCFGRLLKEFIFEAEDVW